MKQYILVCILFLGAVFQPLALGAAPVGSCHAPGLMCTNFISGYTASQARAACARYNIFTFSLNSCPRSNRVGICTAQRDGKTLESIYYTNAEQAERSCRALKGSFRR